ncbi:WD40 repeat domain-containing protein [Streptomyces longwoodensis]|uniref:WD40 repeat domain-containing protein n=1 Tax=Streptomyces longwoodensis TaxID=68231 RepID=UPI002E80EE76|nr:WD40 repeat domain-containing protein [Streptomyces longwoodensis]WUC60031.1 WD40 repeat domain-containing protein [Streptomyces longwoodensis]
MTGYEVVRFPSGFSHAVGTLLAMGRNGDSLLFSSLPDGSEIGCWDARTGGRIWYDDEGMSGCNDKAPVRLLDGEVLLAVATEDGVEWWDASSGRRRQDMTWDGWTIWALADGILPDGRPILVGAGQDGAVYRWDATDGDLIGSSQGFDSMTAVTFVPSPDGFGVIVSGDESGRIWRWSAADGQPLGAPFPAHGSRLRVIQRLPVDGGRLFVSCGQDGVMKRWDVTTGAQVGSDIVAGTDVFSVASVDVGGKGVLLAAGADDIVRAWDAGTGETITLSLDGTVVSALTQRNGESLLATSTARGVVTVHTCSFQADWQPVTDE